MKDDFRVCSSPGPEALLLVTAERPLDEATLHLNRGARIHVRTRMISGGARAYLEINLNGHSSSFLFEPGRDLEGREFRAEYAQDSLIRLVFANPMQESYHPDYPIYQPQNGTVAVEIDVVQGLQRAPIEWYNQFSSY